MTTEQEIFLEATREIEKVWLNFMHTALRKPHYRAKKKGWNKVYECKEYKCDAHPRGCFFCKHCTDIWIDPFTGPYMCACEKNYSTHKGVYGKCKHFNE